MPKFTFFYNVRVGIQKFSSGQELLSKWNEEAQASIGAIDAGVIQIWKDAADATVYVVVEIEADDAATAHGNHLEMTGSLPMGASGELIIEEARSVIPYKEWAEYLAGR